MGTFVVGVLVLILFIFVKEVRKGRETPSVDWVTVARRLKLLYRHEGFGRPRSLRGSYAGYKLAVVQESRDWRVSKVTSTRYTVYYPTLRLGLLLRRQPPRHGERATARRSELQLGDPSFDDEVLCQARRRAAAIEYLTPDRRVVIVDFLRVFGGARITDSRVEYVRDGYAGTADRMESTLRHLCELARALTGGRPGSAGVEGEPPPAAAPGSERAEALILEEQLSSEEIERFFATERSGTPPRAVREERASAPLSEPIALEPVAPETVVPEPAAPETIASEPTLAGTAEETAALLFADHRLSSDTARVFTDECAGRTVRWAGRVVRSESYFRDSEFGAEPGLKVTLELCELREDSGRKLLVSAILQLSEESRAEVERAGEQPLRFEGRLVRCDAFMRHLYVADGRLLS